MAYIKIQNLEPIVEFEQRVDNRLKILIGEQASGKSTVAKTIFYCKSISEEFKKYLMYEVDILNVSEGITLFTDFKKKLRTRFVEYFRTTKHMQPFRIEYTYDNNQKKQHKENGDDNV